MKSKRKQIITYYPVSYVQIGKLFVRKEEIEFIDIRDEPRIRIRLTSGTEILLERREVPRVLDELGFNQK